ncbi:MAG TPA: hypothetical protein VHD90_09905, partial [Phototrophicaceae bacterium]|nr:hypothetical protein [Phototrophicaceae bacterium]
MAKTILGEYILVQNEGQRNPTAVAVESFVTPGKLSLSISVVAETLEGESESLQPAEMAVHAVLDSLHENNAPEPQTLILDAFRAANRE